MFRSCRILYDALPRAALLSDARRKHWVDWHVWRICHFCCAKTFSNVKFPVIFSPQNHQLVCFVSRKKTLSDSDVLLLYTKQGVKREEPWSHIYCYPIPLIIIGWVKRDVCVVCLLILYQGFKLSPQRTRRPEGWEFLRANLRNQKLSFEFEVCYLHHLNFHCLHNIGPLDIVIANEMAIVDMALYLGLPT